ncbi:DUF5996 family protein [Mumia sp. DW29H23]|uniref:DUF5996 family protein n=1 Tax=Mumia sp. DW29H23 TaxID=3421241 RepID=UPI003D69D8E6
MSATRVLTTFRGRFDGKASPTHFFWGSFDLASTLFSGRPAPPHPGGVPHCPDRVTREAYRSELWSCGYWPGGEREGDFYAYAYPSTPDLAQWPVQPSGARWDDGLGEFVLPYEAVRTADDPDEMLTSFLTSTFAAARTSARWPAPG